MSWLFTAALLSKPKTKNMSNSVHTLHTFKFVSRIHRQKIYWLNCIDVNTECHTIFTDDIKPTQIPFLLSTRPKIHIRIQQNITYATLASAKGILYVYGIALRNYRYLWCVSWWKWNNGNGNILSTVCHLLMDRCYLQCKRISVDAQ